MPGALCRPLPLHHFGKPMYHHVEKTANQQTQHAHQAGVQPLHIREHQTTCPSLKIGRYMDTTIPPMMVPSTTMMMGSIRLEMPATISSTSASKKSAALPSMWSIDP